MSVVADRKGAQLTLPATAIVRAGNEEYADFAAELAVVKAFIVASGGWVEESVLPHQDALRIEVAGPAADVDNMIELVHDFLAKWGG